jgi:hypothetical protein
VLQDADCTASLRYHFRCSAAYVSATCGVLNASESAQRTGATTVASATAAIQVFGDLESDSWHLYSSDGGKEPAFHYL